jgi:hypothetical protein
MPPIADGPVTEGQATDPAMTPPIPVDPVRFTVHLMFAIYLAPVILIVCLIGATSVLASRATRMALKVGQRLTRGNGSRPARTIRLGEDKNGPRLIGQRQRSRSTH